MTRALAYINNCHKCVLLGIPVVPKIQHVQYYIFKVIWTFGILIWKRFIEILIDHLKYWFQNMLKRCICLVFIQLKIRFLLSINRKSRFLTKCVMNALKTNNIYPVSHIDFFKKPNKSNIYENKMNIRVKTNCF